MSQAQIQKKAVSLFDHIKENMADKTEKEIKAGFTGSNGWFANFKIRNEIKSVSLQGEAKSADHEAARNYPAELKAIIEEGKYSDEQIFNGVFHFTFVHLL